MKGADSKERRTSSVSFQLDLNPKGKVSEKLPKKIESSSSMDLSTFLKVNLATNEAVDGFEAQITHLNSIISLKNQQIKRLQHEIQSILKIQVDQAAAIQKTVTESEEIRKQIKALQRSFGETTDDKKTAFLSTELPVVSSDSDEFIPSISLAFLKIFLTGDHAATEEMLNRLENVQDNQLRGQVAQQMLRQIQRAMALNQSYERLIDEKDPSHLHSVIEGVIVNELNCRSVVCWEFCAEANVYFSISRAAFRRSDEGIFRKAKGEVLPIFINDLECDELFSEETDQYLKGAKNVLLIPIAKKSGDHVYLIEITDLTDFDGTASSPSAESMLIVEYFMQIIQSLAISRIRSDEFVYDTILKATKMIVVDYHMIDLLEAIQETARTMIGCEILSILFTDSSNNRLFKIQRRQDGGIQRIFVNQTTAGIAGSAFIAKKTINIARAKDHSAFNAQADGEYPNGSILVLPLIGNKEKVNLLAIARQKRNGIMFTQGDETILEGLSRVSLAAMKHAQSAEQNIEAIKNTVTIQKHYTALLSVAQELSSVLDTDTLVQKVMTKAQQFISSDRCSLFLVDNERNCLWTMLAQATTRIRIQIGEGIAGTVVNTGKIINIPDAYQDSRFNSSVDKSTGYRTKSILCVPILSSDGSVMGCTQMINKLGASEFSAVDEELMSAFNVFCGIALRNAQLFEEAAQKRKKMSALLDIALSLTSAPTLGALTTLLTQRAKELTDAEHCWLFVVNRSRHVYKSTQDEKNTEYSVKMGVVGFVYNTGFTVNSSDPLNDQRFKLVYTRDQKINPRSILVIPVFDAQKQVVAVMSAVNKRTLPKFSDYDQELLQDFTAFAGLALHQWLTRDPEAFWSTDPSFIEQLSPEDMDICNLPQRYAFCEPVLSSLSSQDFDVLQFPRDEQFRIIAHIFSETKILEEFHITFRTFLRFASEVFREHQNVPFRSLNNSIDSLQFLNCQLRRGQLTCEFTKMELLVMLVVVFCRNVATDTAREMANSRSQIPLSFLFREQPISKTYQCSLIVQIFDRPNCNIIETLNEDETRTFWRMVFDCVYATARNRNEKLLQELKQKITDEGTFPLDNPENRLLLMKLLIKTSEFATIARSINIANPWTNGFFEDSVKSSSTPDPLERARNQVEFCSNIVLPFFELLATSVRGLKPIYDSAKGHFATWAKMARSMQGSI